MVQAKTELFNSKLIHTAGLCKALSHPARLQILQFIAESKVCITGDISEELPLGRTTVNQHLTELKAAGLITGNIEGAKTRYCLNQVKIIELTQLLEEFLKSIYVENFKCT